MRQLVFTVVIISALLSLCTSQIILPSLFSDNVILQRDAIECIKGKAGANNIIALYIPDCQAQSVFSNSRGEFEICFRVGRATTRGYTMTLRESRFFGPVISTTVIRNVRNGDRYLFYGQSNVKFTVAMGFNASAEAASANYEDIAFWSAKDAYSSTPLEQAAHELENGWNNATPFVVGGGNWTHTSALAYFFARDLYLSLDKKVPIGIVIAAYNGVPIQSLSSPDALARCPPISATQTRPQNMPSVVYNAMIHPFLTSKFKALVFWQGEGDLYDQSVYECQLTEMVRDHRSKFGDLSLPFFNIGISAYFRNVTGEQLFANLRILQQTLDLPRTYLVPALDYGDRQVDLANQTGIALTQLRALYLAFGIHPRNKQPIAKRLLNIVLSVLYNKRVDISYPTLSKVQKANQRRDSSKLEVTIKLKNGKDLELKPTVDCVSCCGSSGIENAFKFKYSNGTISQPDSITINTNNSVELVMQNGTNIVAVEYAYDDYPQCVLYNKAGLPLEQFRKTIG